MDKIYIIFDVNGQRLKRNNPNLITVGGSYGLIKAKFNLQESSAWVYCDSIVASFKSESYGPMSYEVDKITSECFVPQEVLKERWFDVTLSGYEGAEIKITSTAVRNEYLGRFEDTPAIPEEPIPDIYAQFLRDIMTKGDRVVFANGFLSLYSGEVELSKTPIAGGGAASQIQLRVFDGWIQSSYVSESPVWVNLISLSELEGDPGPAGYTPIKGVDYFDGLKGDPGTPGLKGDPGPAGYTPIKGVDYFDGTNGQSAYELAVISGFQGTLSEWLSSLQALVTPDAVGGVLNAAPETVTADDDTIPFTDVSDSNKIKKIKLSSIITGIQALFETIFMKLGSGQVIDDAVTLNIELQKYPKVLKTAVLTTCTSLIVTYPTSYSWNDEYVLYFNTGTTPPVPTWPAGTKWFGGATPTLVANKEYVVSFQNGQAVIGNV